MSYLIYLIFVCDHLFGSCLECLEKNCEGKHYQTFLPAGALLRQGPAMAGAPCPGSSALSPSSWGKLENCNPGSHHPASLSHHSPESYTLGANMWKTHSVAELLFFNHSKRGDWRSYQDWWPKHRKHLASSYFSMHGQSALFVAFFLMDPSFEPFQTVLFLAQWHDFCQHTTCSFPGVGAGNGWQPKGGQNPSYALC